MNKSLITNLVALSILLVGIFTNYSLLKNIGIFALSGAITNWLAVHMLFEKVPGLYGSGVIPNRFEEFKQSIHNLIMTEFFTQSNIERFTTNKGASDINLSPIIAKIDLSPTFDSLIEVVQASSFGQMLGMFGGTEALEPMRQPFVEKMSEAVVKITQSDNFKDLLQAHLTQSDTQQNIQQNIATVVTQRLNELTPAIVKDIVQGMIKQHLGWLVVWGGVFGGLIGLIAALLNI
ncbi:DUF445 domain-containing protein [Paraglaciecola marina]|uniref:DUF445 domain-containing protein n=1 Tax=Paraglaciecola marina TaxID=2500157 RepID=UPI001060160C|nr:DUF445 domain-containing protein [Paraglaciecola marina]